MDGYQASSEMRAIERHEPSRQKAEIIAVTALSGEEEKRHGLVE
jgi:CheY-like chemotaxis protein